jgi:Flp pilus assembly pilin Flp
MKKLPKSDESGAAMVEYIALSALLVLVAYASLASLGEKSAQNFCISASRMNDQASDLCVEAPNTMPEAYQPEAEGANEVGGAPATQPDGHPLASPEPSATACLPPVQYCPSGVICVLNTEYCFYDCSYCDPVHNASQS